MLQLQIDPSVPTNIPPGQLDDFKGFLDGVHELHYRNQRADSC